jgi:hypothetical protein
MSKTLEQEATEFKSKKKTPLDASDKVALRFYMGNILGGLMASGGKYDSYEAIRAAHTIAKAAVQYEKDNF